MELAFQILIPVAVFVVLGALMSTMLAIASRAFAVKTDERVEAIAEILPGANCGGCGYAGCHALAEAIVRRRRRRNGEEDRRYNGNRGRVVGQNESAGHVLGNRRMRKEKVYLRG